MLGSLAAASSIAAGKAVARGTDAAKTILSEEKRIFGYVEKIDADIDPNVKWIPLVLIVFILKVKSRQFLSNIMLISIMTSST